MVPCKSSSWINISAMYLGGLQIESGHGYWVPERHFRGFSQSFRAIAGKVGLRRLKLGLLHILSDLVFTSSIIRRYTLWAANGVVKQTINKWSIRFFPHSLYTQRQERCIQGVGEETWGKETIWKTQKLLVRIIAKWLFKKRDGKTLTVLNWLMTGAGGGRLWLR
jgi:hypothetical protein